MKRSIITRSLGGAIAGLLVAAVLAVPASASPGDLSYLGCLGNLPGCGPTNPGAALTNATSTAMTPDGRHLYVSGANGLSHFLVDAAGEIAFAGCVGNLAGCAPTVPANAVSAGGSSYSGLAMSSDGRHLYLANSGGVSHLTLDAAGNATFAGCIGSLSGCTATNPTAALTGAVGIAWKSGHLYVSSLTSDTVSHLTINGAGGLVFANCVGPLAGCSGLPVSQAVADSYSMGLSADGTHLYATSFGSLVFGDVAHFSVTGNGNLSWVGCIGNRAGCAPTTPANALVGATGLAIGPNGQSLYVASNGADAVAWLGFDGGGNPQLMGCVGKGGCTPVTPANALDGVFNLALSSDGAHMYAVSLISDAASHLTVGANGSPAFAGCSGALSGCTPIAPANALDGASDLVLRPDRLYVASRSGNGVSRFSIEQPPPAPVVTPDPTPVPPIVVNPTGIDADRDGFFAGQDCNDGNATIRPGAVEVKGNRLDENCDGLAEPFPTLTSGVVTKWSWRGSTASLSVLQVTQQFPKGWKAEIRCKGKKCPFKTKKLKAGKVSRGASNIISSLSSKQRKFRDGQTIEVWVSAPNFNTTVKRYALKRNKIPTTQPFCVIPGETKPKKTCN